MHVDISVSENGRYIRVIHSGSTRLVAGDKETSHKQRVATTIGQEKLKHASLNRISMVLVDFTLADLETVNLLMVDDVASGIKSLLPQITTMAIIRPRGVRDDYFEHAQNVCSINGIDCQLFKNASEARDWLLGS